MRLPVVLRQTLQPGIPVGRKHGVRPSGLRQHLIPVKQRLILERLEGNSVGLNAALTAASVALLGLRFVVAIGKHRSNAKLPRQRPGISLSCPAMAHDHCAAACAQRRIKLDQRLADELDASIGRVAPEVSRISRSKTKAQ
jgi:hypothetical protein